MKTKRELLKFEEQIENKALRSWRDNCNSYDYFEEAYCDGYITGAEENGVIWHKQSDADDILNPCRLCENCNDEIHNTKVCVDCCYFYGSQFKIKE
jgi:hypothetical protein